MQIQEPPEEYICPLTLEMMLDPVIGNDGHSYERAAIIEWLDKHQSSPISRAPMKMDDIKPNFALRAGIERWKETNVAPVPIEIEVDKRFKVMATQSNSGAALSLSIDNEDVMSIRMINVLDTSGSMSMNAAEKESVEGCAFSRMDLVKHSIKTVAALLHSEYSKTPSSMSIVTFNSKSELNMPMRPLSTVGLAAVNQAIDDIKPTGMTNIWDGLRIGLEQAETCNQPRSQVILNLFTDGEPTASLLPLKGLIPTLQKKLNSMDVKVTINVFGFGYNLDSKLLESICKVGNGSYGFIPDCSMVGTVFINSCAAALSTVAHHVSLKIGQESHFVGSFQKGVPRSIHFPVGFLNHITDIGIVYDSNLATIASIEWSADYTLVSDFLAELHHEVSCLKNVPMFKMIDEIPIFNLRKKILEMNPAEDSILMAIANDIYTEDANGGQIMKAISRQDWFNNWGVNHLIAYNRALELEQCINFKDKVVQFFAGSSFLDLQDRGIQIFTDLPAPVPSGRSYGHANVNKRNYAPINMADYVVADGGCFTGDCKILMNDGSSQLVSDLKKGDVLCNGYAIKTVVYTPLKDTAKMCQFPGGLIISPFHPVRLNDKWAFPSDVYEMLELSLSGYYNLVLDHGHVVTINGIEVCTLGHGFTDNEIIAHPYFGTDAVLIDLMKLPGWDVGRVEMDPSAKKRDPFSGLIVTIV